MSYLQAEGGSMSREKDWVQITKKRGGLVAVKILERRDEEQPRGRNLSIGLIGET